MGPVVVAPRLLVAGVLGLGGVGPAGEDNDVALAAAGVGPQHDVAVLEVALADLVADGRQRLGRVAVREAPARAHVAGAVAPRRPAVGTVAAAVGVALRVRDLRAHPLLGRVEHLRTRDVV